ncbi:uncharacterized protein LOC121367412 [Gigantopelta aegis]|uniref:uncharacterized protein LOC121367412 n=1 Tax=Gigantopelta aegis TaxID=1735272 RepID=UPI001B88BC1E|nr:uncharacterized protein LOC121367412 [Gigantopelta aegis]XP_041347511.1 uncharacterized protein LOC121367412 [Gigantopelta aegis]
MDADQQEAILKKKLQSFLSEMLKLGTVKGFRYFATYMRGREEMVISILNSPQSTSDQFMDSGPSSPVLKEHRKSESFTSQKLPYDKRSLLLSRKTQMILSGYGEGGVALLPASPSDHEDDMKSDQSTLFLIAGYARYNCPYVWVRSNHDRLFRLTGEKLERDSPLRLKSTIKWKDQDINVWDLIAELVKLSTYPAPRNPFEIDLEFFSMLPVSEQVLSTAAMANCLQKIMLHTPDDKPFAGKVFEDLQLVVKCHFAALQKLAKQGLPVLEQYQQQQQQRQQQQQQQQHMPGQRRQRYSGSGSSHEAPGSQYDQQVTGYGGYMATAAPSRF